MAPHRVLVVLGPDGGVSGDLGTAGSVVIADVDGMEIGRWCPHTFSWDGDPGADRRQADLIAFIDEEMIEAAVVGTVAADLRRMLAEVGVPVFERRGISARAAAVSAGTVLDLVHNSDHSRRWDEG